NLHPVEILPGVEQAASAAKWRGRRAARKGLPAELSPGNGRTWPREIVRILRLRAGPALAGRDSRYGIRGACAFERRNYLRAADVVQSWRTPPKLIRNGD